MSVPLHRLLLGCSQHLMMDMSISGLAGTVWNSRVKTEPIMVGFQGYTCLWITWHHLLFVLNAQYLCWESNIALAKVKGHLAIGYPRRPDGKAFQISRGGKMANNTKLANSVKQTRCLLVTVFLFPWSPQEYFFGWRQPQAKPSRRQNNKALPVNTHGSSA